MYKDYAERKTGVIVIDIEADSLTPSKIWCMCWKDILTKEKGTIIDMKELREFFEAHRDALFIGHNILRFDGPVLNKFVDARITADNCIDTLIMSMLYHPSLPGGHSLSEWGARLGNAKIDFHDFSRLTPEMIKYCEQDVEVTASLFIRLMKVMDKVGFSERSFAIQHKFMDILERQQKNGFKFNRVEAERFYSELRQMERDYESKIHEAFPPVLEEHGRYKRAYRKDGSFSLQYLRHLETYEKIDLLEDGEYIVYGRTPFNIGSPKQRVEKLEQLGWVPEEFTEKGTPKPFEKGKMSPSLEKFLENTDMPSVKLIAQWMTINGRANMINTWLENCGDDDAIHGKLFVADTLRLRHQAPNTANIPAVRSSKEGKVLRGIDGWFTYEARDLWVARKGRLLVGTDASGLELRMLAHYLNRPDFTDQVVNGDPHQYNADLVGITRSHAKTLIYAIMYGAAAPKIAKTLGVTVREGAAVRTMFLEKLGLKELIEECQDEQAKGRVSLVDGSLVICPSPHAALNYKLQGGGARVMAGGAIILESRIARLGLDCLKVGDIHDEWQYDVDPDHAEAHARESIQAIRRSGEALGLNVPLDGDAKIGRTWAETH